MRFRMLPAATALVAVALLVGCVPQDPVITPVPEPSSSPVFASDEEALAAATEAYGRYRTALDQIFMDGGRGTEVLDEVAVGAQLEAELDGFAKVREEGWRSSGGTVFETKALQRYDASNSSGGGLVTAYVCEDVSSVDVVDESGDSVVSDTRPATTLYEVTFDLASDGASLLVSNKEVWGEGGC